MLHILSTHGFLLSFNLLNFQSSRVDICSPPQNLPDQSGLNQFRQITFDTKPSSSIQQNTPPQQSLATAPKMSSTNDFQQMSNLTFSIPETGATSTPAKPPQMQAKPTFGLPTANTQQTKPAMTNLFGVTPNSGFGTSFNLSGPKESAKPFITQPTAQTPAPAPVQTTTQNTVAANTAKASTEASQPFLTVPPNYKPATQPTK